MNTLYYGDNLKILQRREYFPDACVDLVYLDPPFNSNRNYNVLFKDESGLEADSQIMAFEDTWHWKGAAATYDDLILEGDKVSEMLQAFRSFIGENQMMAYLVMMAVRLKELHRVLKPTGSLYLHCDSVASHYLKILLDSIFGSQNFVNEIVWKRADTVKGNFGQGTKRFDPNIDNIFFYRRSEANVFHTIFTEYSQKYIKDFYKYVEPDTGRIYRLISMTGPGDEAKGNPQYEVMGVTRYWRYSQARMNELIAAGMVVQTRPGNVPQRKQYLDEGKGVSVQTLWDDIPALHSQSGERLGYPTQKPVALLERIIQASSNEGDVVLDPFAGCGTTIAAAQKLNRQWIGIDVTQLSIALLKNRLEGNFGQFPKKDYEVVGEPEDLHDAKKLAGEDRYQFQYWALSQINARPLGGQMDGRTGKKGSDKGIDGIKVFVDDNSGKAKRVIVQVKSGHVKSGDIRDLVGTLDREGAAIGVFITLEKPTSHMINEAASADFFTSEHFGKFPRIQILTIEEILAGKTVQMPQTLERTFKQAGKVPKADSMQDSLGFD